MATGKFKSLKTIVMLEQIYNYIFKYQPNCDSCISEAFGYKYPQYANGYCRQLLQLRSIIRTRGLCPKCNRKVTLNRTIIES